MKARDKADSPIMLQPGHGVTGVGDVLIQTNSPDTNTEHEMTD